MSRQHPTKRALAALTTVVLSFTLAACGDDDTTGAEPTAIRTASNGDVFNDADVTFATEMIPHHAQAIEMVTMTVGRPLDPAVRRLADAIREAQTPEVETMVDWLTAWKEPVPVTSLDHASVDHGSEAGGDTGEATGMPGMMSADEMTALENASDADFQDLWLQMMVEHHTGAVDMATTEQEDGEFGDALDLAASIEASQEREIDTMRALLG